MASVLGIRYPRRQASKRHPIRSDRLCEEMEKRATCSRFYRTAIRNIPLVSSTSSFYSGECTSLLGCSVCAFGRDKKQREQACGEKEDSNQPERDMDAGGYRG